MDIKQDNIYGNNNVSLGSLPRQITSESEQLFINDIKKYPTKHNEIIIRTYLGDAECHNLCYVIENIFKKVGWVVKNSSEIPKYAFQNVVFGVPKSEEKSTTTLIIYNWLNMNNLKVAAEIVPDEKGYIIFVGQNV